MINELAKDPTIRTALIIPSYNESEALKVFLCELLPLLPKELAIIIVDDSNIEIARKIQDQVDEINKTHQIQVTVDCAKVKTGRGAAVKRGMKRAVNNFPNLKFVIECDADGSHTPADVLSVIQHRSSCDLVIGSRYLPGSKITNWPWQRKVFSRILNLVIPKILKVPVKDITNGLRRYSIEASKLLISTESLNSGFVYLSEQALTLRKAELSICEIPIHFVNRVLGESTVTSKEVIESIIGIKRIFSHKENVIK